MVRARISAPKCMPGVFYKNPGHFQKQRLLVTNAARLTNVLNRRCFLSDGFGAVLKHPQMGRNGRHPGSRVKVHQTPNR